MRLRSENLSWRELDGEAVLLDLAESKYLNVNTTGTTLLRLLVEDRTTDELVHALIAAYGITESQATADVEAFTNALAEKGLLIT
jgi:coenzyme PQQ synthesis protein D (PqqD)